jgi:hypothetical protein
MKRAVKTRFKGSPHRLSMGSRRNIYTGLARKADGMAMNRWRIAFLRLTAIWTYCGR